MSFYNDNITLLKFKDRFQAELICQHSTTITYQKKNKVFDIVNDKVYSSIVYNNTNQPLTDNTKWEDITTTALLDKVFIDTIIQPQIDKIIANNLIVHNLIYDLPNTDPRKQNLIFLYIAHILQDSRNKQLGIQGVEIDKSGIVTSASDGTNSYSFNVLPYMQHPTFRLFQTTKFGIEYYLQLLTISQFPSNFVLSRDSIGI